MLYEVIIIVIAIACICGYLYYYYYKNAPLSDANNRLLMEYMGMLNTTYDRLTSQQEYKRLFEENMYKIDKNFKKVVGDTFRSHITDHDRNDILKCMALLKNIDDNTYNIVIKENTSQLELMTDIYTKIKSAVSREVSNEQLIKPLCIVLTISIVLQME